MKSTLLWTHRAVLAYYVASSGRPIDIRTVSAVIGEDIRAVEQACHDLVQVEVLTPTQSEDALWPLFQLVEQEVGRARMILAEGIMLRKQGKICMNFQDTFQHTGILGLDEILGGQKGADGTVRGRPKGERIVLVGPPGSGKTLLALSLMYQALMKPGAEKERGLFLTTEQPAAYLRDSISSGLFKEDLKELFDPPRVRLDIQDFPPFDPISVPPSTDREIIDDLIKRLRSMIEGESPPSHLIVDGLTAMQAVLSSRAEARRLTNLILARLSWPQSRFDLFVMTAEARGYGERIGDGFDDYLFDTVIYLNIIETPADRRLRTIEITKSRGRHARTGRHTFSIVNEKGAESLIRSAAAHEEIKKYGTPVVIFPREPRGERPVKNLLEEYKGVEYLKTGIDGLDQLLSRDKCSGLLKRSVTVLIGGPGTASGLLGLRYLAQGIEENARKPVLLVSFGRDHEDLALLVHNFPWLRRILEQKQSADAFHVLYYRPVNLDQNRLFYEIRKEIETDEIDRVVIDSVSSLPLVDVNTESSSDFLVTLIGLLKELHCTAMLSYVLDQSPNPLASPGKFITSLADNILVLRNEYDIKTNIEMQKRLFILKARGTDAIGKEMVLSIGEDLTVIPLDSKMTDARPQPRARIRKKA